MITRMTPLRLSGKNMPNTCWITLKVEPVKNSFLVNVSFSSTDKSLAQKIPEAIQKEYLKLSMTTRQQSYTMLREWLDNELTRLGTSLELSEK